MGTIQKTFNKIKNFFNNPKGVAVTGKQMRQQLSEWSDVGTVAKKNRKPVYDIDWYRARARRRNRKKNRAQRRARRITKLNAKR